MTNIPVALILGRQDCIPDYIGFAAVSIGHCEICGKARPLDRDSLCESCEIEMSLVNDEPWDEPGE